MNGRCRTGSWNWPGKSGSSNKLALGQSCDHGVDLLLAGDAQAAVPDLPVLVEIESALLASLGSDQTELLYRDGRSAARVPLVGELHALGRGVPLVGHLLGLHLLGPGSRAWQAC